MEIFHLIHGEKTYTGKEIQKLRYKIRVAISFCLKSSIALETRPKKEMFSSCETQKETKKRGKSEKNRNKFWVVDWE